MARIKQAYTIDGRIFAPAQRLPRNLPQDDWGNGAPEQTCGNPNCHKGEGGGRATFRALNSDAWGYAVGRKMCCSYSCMRELERLDIADNRKRSGPEKIEPLRELWRQGYAATTAAARVSMNPARAYEYYAQFEEEAQAMSIEVRIVPDPAPCINRRRNPCVCPVCGKAFWPPDVSRWTWTIPGKTGKNGYKRAVCCSYTCMQTLTEQRKRGKQTGV